MRESTHEHVRAHICVYSHVLILGSVFGLAPAQKEIDLQIQRMGFKSTMLALSLLELLFGLHINHTISDKTSNCSNVVPVSMLTLAVW